MSASIKVAILDDHQGIIDGYLYRLSNAPDIEVLATIAYGEDLEPMLKQYNVDVLLLDVHVPVNAQNPNPYPILHVLPKLLQAHPDLSVLVISMHAQRTLIKAVFECGASGYVLKDDHATIRELAAVIRSVAGGGVHMSQQAYQQLIKLQASELEQPLTHRQLEALSLCAAHPEYTTAQLGQAMNVANSTLRNLLSGAYLKLKVPNRTAAVAKARQMGLITPDVMPPEVG